ncbi:MAG: hypothetical protein AAF089_17395 [Bacteroidota bacterium]
MSIYRTTFLVAGLLIATGLVAYVASWTGSMTALIPTFLGLIIGGLAALAQARPGAAKHAMHGVAVVALLGALGSLGRVVPAIIGSEIGLPIAFAAQSITAVLCIALIVAAVGHFRANRRSRASTS